MGEICTNPLTVTISCLQSTGRADSLRRSHFHCLVALYELCCLLYGLVSEPEVGKKDAAEVRS